MITRPENLDPTVYYKPLIDKVAEEDAVQALENSLDQTVEIMESIFPEQESFAYAEGKWNLKQLFQHLVDCERIMAYRALSLARGEKGSLLGFDDQAYVDRDGSQNVSLKSIQLDFITARKSTLSLVKSIPVDQLDLIGNANGISSTARMVVWFIAAHNYHHNSVVLERYLNTK